MSLFRRDVLVIPPPATRTEYVTRDVHEHRAPTDESVKLLREMEDAADKRRLLAVKLETNEFTGIVEVSRDHAGMALKARCRLKLNGEELLSEAEVNTFTFDGDVQMELATKLRDALAKDIASKILAVSLPAAFTPLLGYRRSS